MSDPVTGYFTHRADHYARFRPSYPTDAVRTILAGLRKPARAVDLGCGTGIASRLLAEAGAQVVGIEPNEAMLDEARREGGGPSYQYGTAEASGLEAASAELVVCAQSFHWFELMPTLKELHRILAPGGRLALVWNVRREDTEFGEAYAQVARKAQQAAESSGQVVRRNRTADPTIGGRFGDVRTLVFPNDVRLDQAALIGRALSTSYFPLFGDLHAELVAELNAIFEQFAERDGTVVFPQRTEVVLATRTADAGGSSSGTGRVSGAAPLPAGSGTGRVSGATARPAGGGSGTGRVSGAQARPTNGTSGTGSGSPAGATDQ